MARVFVVAVRDRKLETFMRPFCVRAAGEAVRGFIDEVNRPAEDNLMFRHSDDFSIYHIGYFDEDTGLVSALESGPNVLLDGSVARREKE